jgi:hypothetical protein
MDAELSNLKMKEVLLLSMITASISYTITETKLFLPLRDWVNKQSAFLGKLVHCGYCTGHWIAFILVAIYQPKIVYKLGILDYFLTALVIAWLAGFQWIIMCWLMKKAGK